MSSATIGLRVPEGFIGPTLVIGVGGKLGTLNAMIAIVVATITVRGVFKRQSVFLKALAVQSINYSADPLSLHLQRLGVSTVMEHRLARRHRPAGDHSRSLVNAGKTRYPGAVRTAHTANNKLTRRAR